MNKSDNLNEANQTEKKEELIVNESADTDKTVIIDSTKSMNSKVESNDFDYTKHFKTTSDIKNQSTSVSELNNEDYEDEINKQIEESLKKLTEDEVMLSREEYGSMESDQLSDESAEVNSDTPAVNNNSGEVTGNNSDKTEKSSAEENDKKDGPVSVVSDEAPKKFDKKKKIILFSSIGGLAGVALLVFILNVTGNSFGATFSKAERAYAEGNYESALDNYLKASNTNEGRNNVDMLLHLADTYLRLEKYDDSIATYNRVLSIQGDNGTAIAGLLENYTKKNDVSNINATLRKYENNSGIEEYIAAYDVTSPKASVDGGSYDEDKSVRLTSDPGTTIYYTLDGNDPSDVSRIYTRPINITEGTTVLSVIAYTPNGVQSKVTTYEYNIDYMLPDSPTVSPSNGKYTQGTTVKISVPEDSTVYYTTNGSTPTKESTKYEKEIELPQGHTTLSVVAINNRSEKTSEVVKREYDIVTTYDQGAAQNGGNNNSNNSNNSNNANNNNGSN